MAKSLCAEECQLLVSGDSFVGVHADADVLGIMLHSGISEVAIFTAVVEVFYLFHVGRACHADGHLFAGGEEVRIVLFDDVFGNVADCLGGVGLLQKVLPRGIVVARAFYVVAVVGHGDDVVEFLFSFGVDLVEHFGTDEYLALIV